VSHALAPLPQTGYTARANRFPASRLFAGRLFADRFIAGRPFAARFLAARIYAVPMRLDKWLWAARFFKTRTLAAKACDLNRVQAKGQPLRSSREVRVAGPSAR